MHKQISFSTSIKQEICQHEYTKNCQKNLFLPFLLNQHSWDEYLDAVLSSLTLSINQDFVAQKVSGIAQTIFANATVHLKKNASKYQLVINGNLENSLRRLKKVFETQQYLSKKGVVFFLTGVFLAFGNLNNPESLNYHLEIQCNNQKFFSAVTAAFTTCNFSVKTMIRRQKTVIYLKRAEVICDFLKMIHATSCALAFENQRIQRGFNNRIQKVNNFDVANLSRTIKTNCQQIALIKSLNVSGKIHKFSQGFRDFCSLRVKNPTVSLTQLVSLYNLKYGKHISRSGLGYYVSKLKKLSCS